MLEHVPHGFSNRHGPYPYLSPQTFNLKAATDPACATVVEHQNRVRQALGCSNTSWRFLDQIHKNRVVRIHAENTQIEQADAMWTTDPHVILAIYAADCVPILVANTEGNVVGAAHAGWRGTALKVASHLLTSIHTHTRTAPESMFAVLGPAIGPCCFRVGKKTRDILRNAYPTAIKNAVYDEGHDQYRINLWALNRFDLQQAGIPYAQIDTVAVCTCCNFSYFSHRREPTDLGRHAGIIAVKRQG